MSVKRQLNTERCVRLGDVLYDEHRRIFLLCRCCLRCFSTLDMFQRHLKLCGDTKPIVNTKDQLRYDESKRETKQINSNNEINIYNTEAVKSSKCNEIDWQAELEDPRWYNDEQQKQQTPSAVPSNVKAKAPPTNAKENVNKLPMRCVKSAIAQQQQQQQQTNRQLCNASNVQKRAVLSSQQQRPIRSYQNTMKHKASVAPAAPAATNIQKIVHAVPIPSKPAPAPAVMSAQRIAATNILPVAAATAVAKDTQQILNKLRACGVEVKRRCTHQENSAAADEAASADKNQVTLDIMRKLQSKGIKCTKVNNVKRLQLELG